MHKHAYTCVAGTVICVSNCKCWAEKSVTKWFWWDKDEANWLSRSQPSLHLKPLWHLTRNSFSSLKSLGVAAFQLDEWRYSQTVTCTALPSQNVNGMRVQLSLLLRAVEKVDGSLQLLCFFQTDMQDILHTCKMWNKTGGSWIQLKLVVRICFTSWDQGSLISYKNRDRDNRPRNRIKWGQQ